MEPANRKPCARCRRLQTQVDVLQAEIVALRQQLATARKDSSTSSKPPSSDIVKPKPAQDGDGAKRSIGAQPGHAKHDREPFPAEAVSVSLSESRRKFPARGRTQLNWNACRILRAAETSRSSSSFGRPKGRAAVPRGLADGWSRYSDSLPISQL